MKFRPVHFFLLLSFLYLGFSLSVYLGPASQVSDAATGHASEGRLVWQKYNCQSCHQLYGLGGYLGPDLTNVYSEPGKGEPYIRAMIRSGTAQMPAFRMNAEEEAGIIAFLRITDASGSADPRNFTVQTNGMIEAK